jgi:glutathione peroxidase
MLPNSAALLGLAAGMLVAAIGLASLAPNAESAPAKAAKAPTSVLDYSVKNIDGRNVPLKNYKGKVVLIVNTASKCGLTPQYAGLESLYQKYKGRGLRIVAFPANNFAGQEPGTNDDIKTFCSTNYKTTFDLMGKVSVAGDDQTPVYQFLTSKETNPKFAGPIEWNFGKFLVGPDGQVVARFAPNKDPMSPEVTQAVEAQLARVPAAKAPAKKAAAK